MSTAGGENIVDEIKSRCNIVDVIGRVVPLKKAGSNYKGNCPFHNEKTPSFVVSETKQIYTCFGCGATGDVIEFVQRYHQLEFMPAIEKLASEYGIDINWNYSEKRKNKEELYNINREAAKFFYKEFRAKNNPGYAYMSKRGLTPEILNKFGIGYADEKWDSLYKHLKTLGFEEQKLLDLGLISHSKGKYYDKFRNRVIFPIINTGGKVIGFGGRILDDGNPKYLNSPETPVFSKKNNLYGLNITRQEISKQNQGILVEGYMDAISLYQHGVRNVAASLGTALTENQSRLLKRYTENIILSYDSDEAGQNAALRGMDILYKEGCNVKVLNISQGKDPDDFIKERGREEFLKLVDQALPFVDYKFNLLAKKHDTDDLEGRILFLKDAVKVLKQLSPIEADIYIKKLSQDMKISEGAIRMEFSGNNIQETTMPNNTARDADINSFHDEISPLEKNAIKLILTNETYFHKLAEFEEIFSSRSGFIIYSNIKEQYAEKSEPDTKQLMDVLEQEQKTVLEDIMDNIKLADKEEEVLADCINTIKANRLSRKEKELMMRLSMAEEDENKETITELMEELMKIQKMMKDGRNTH